MCSQAGANGHVQTGFEAIRQPAGIVGPDARLVVGDLLGEVVFLQTSDELNDVAVIVFSSGTGVSPFYYCYYYCYYYYIFIFHYIFIFLFIIFKQTPLLPLSLTYSPIVLNNA